MGYLREKPPHIGIMPETKDSADNLCVMDKIKRIKKTPTTEMNGFLPKLFFRRKTKKSKFITLYVFRGVLIETMANILESTQITR